MVLQGKSAESAEIFKSWRLFVFLYWILKVTTLIRQITSNRCLGGYATTPVVIFQVKRWSDSIFFFLIFFFNLITLFYVGNAAICLVIIQSFLNFPRFRGFVVQGKSAESAEIFKSWKFFISFIEVLKSVNENSERCIHSFAMYFMLRTFHNVFHVKELEERCQREDLIPWPMIWDMIPVEKRS